MLNHKDVLNKFTESEVYQLTSELIKIPSYTGLAEQEKQIATFIYDFFKNENIHVEFQEPLENRPNVIATLKGNGNGKSLMLTGHMDTVPPYNMVNSPLSGDVTAGKLYGRGACDMKGALACMMGAMAAIKRSGVVLEGDLVFAGVINEEQKSEGTEYIVRNGPHTDAAIVGEPSGLQIAAGHRGLEWIEIDITGKTTHGGTPHEGINAISKAAKLITRIENDLVPKFKERKHPLIGDPLLNFGVIEGGDQPSSVAGRCKLFIDRRWTPQESFDLIMDELKDLISDLNKEDKDFNAQVKRYFADSNMMLHKPLEIDLDHPIVTSLKKGISISLGKDPEIISFLAWTDASLLSNYAKIPSVVFGPGHLKNAHSEDEFVELAQLKGAYESYVLTAIDFCNEDKKMIEKMIDEIKKRRNEIITDSLKLIDIPSLTRDIDENRKCLDYIASSAQNEGMTTNYTKKKDCLVIEIGKGEETIGVLTHVDVVDAGDLDKWQTPPFKGIFDDDFIIGRGAMDDKVPTAIILNIMKVFQSKDLNYKRKLQLIIGTKEEEIWTDMESFLNEYKTPDFSFTPDGGFPIHNIEKGYADIEIVFPFDNLFPNGRILTLISGDSPNTIPSRGNFVFQQSSEDRTIELISSGESSHSSLPQNGDNAITKLCKMIKGLKLESERLEQILDFILLMNKIYDGSTLGFENDSNHFDGEFIGQTYVNPTILEFRDNKIILNINIRHKLGVSEQSIINIFDRHSKSYGFNYKISNYLDPLYVDKHHPLFYLMDNAYKEVTGSNGGFDLAGGTSYAKALPNTVSWGPVFPGEKDTCHQENEKISIDSVMKCAEIYGRFLYKACID